MRARDWLCVWFLQGGGRMALRSRPRMWIPHSSSMCLAAPILQSPGAAAFYYSSSLHRRRPDLMRSGQRARRLRIFRPPDSSTLFPIPVRMRIEP